jgi:hypothetical protein
MMPQDQFQYQEMISRDIERMYEDIDRLVAEEMEKYSLRRRISSLLARLCRPRPGATARKLTAQVSE